MRLLRNAFLLILPLAVVSCGRGGPLTPLESFSAIKTAAENGDAGAITKNISSSSLDKIAALDNMIRQMKDDQIKTLASLYNCEPARLRNMKKSDYVALYFFVKHQGVDLGTLFREQVVAVDINGDRAVIRVQSGIELIFVREGPYWKLDISDL